MASGGVGCDVPYNLFNHPSILPSSYSPSGLGPLKVYCNPNLSWE
jgi:hypothetical protein